MPADDEKRSRSSENRPVSRNFDRGRYGRIMPILYNIRCYLVSGLLFAQLQGKDYSSEAWLFEVLSGILLVSSPRISLWVDNEALVHHGNRPLCYVFQFCREVNLTCVIIPSRCAFCDQVTCSEVTCGYGDFSEYGWKALRLWRNFTARLLFPPTQTYTNRAIMLGHHLDGR